MISAGDDNIAIDNIAIKASGPPTVGNIAPLDCNEAIAHAYA